MRSIEASLPQPYWGNLSPADKTEFLRLRTSFYQGQRTSSTKDKKIVSFSNELISILKYIQHSEVGRENRTVMVGVCFAGPFIGVNTRQLKNFIGRCKSSINSSLQQLGYVALKTKSKARTCILSIIPSLINDQNILKQWTIRCASDDTQFCFVTDLRSLKLPVITPEDLGEDGHNYQNSTPALVSTNTPPVSSSQPITSISQPKTLQWKPNIYVSANNLTRTVPYTSHTSARAFSVSAYQTQQYASSQAYSRTSTVTSVSVDSYGDGESNLWNEPQQTSVESDWNPIWEQNPVPSSHSAGF
jgi:hypothetical protein